MVTVLDCVLDGVFVFCCLCLSCGLRGGEEQWEIRTIRHETYISRSQDTVTLLQAQCSSLSRKLT